MVVDLLQEANIMIYIVLINCILGSLDSSVKHVRVFNEVSKPFVALSLVKLLPSKMFPIFVEFVDPPNIFSIELWLVEEAPVEDNERYIHVVLSKGFKHIIDSCL